MQPTIIALQDRRRALLSRFEAIQQGAAGFVLIAAGYGRLETAAQGTAVFGGALIAAGLLLLWVAIRELVGKVPWHPGLLNLAAGVALLTEWGVTLAADGGKIIKPSLVMALISLGLGLGHRRLHHRRITARSLRLDAQGLSFHLNPIRNFAVRWDDLASISVQPAEILFQRRSGRRHRIPLGRLDNAGEVVDAVIAASRTVGMESLITHPVPA